MTTRLRWILLAVAGAVALPAALAPAAGAQNGAPGIRASVMPPQALTIVIRSANGTAHGEHVTSPTFAVEPGLPVHITFVNYTHSMHTFTAGAIGVSALIRPAHGSTPAMTTLTFTPHEHGVFDWACLLCPGKGEGNREVMKGKIYAIMQV